MRGDVERNIPGLWSLFSLPSSEDGLKSSDYFT